jgi:prolyl oligopeptidase
MKPGTFYHLFGSICIFGLFSSIAFAQLKYPVTKKTDHVDDYFGTKVSDPYRWLENDSSAEVKSWVQTEQQFTEDNLSKIPFRNAIKARIKEIINYPRFGSAFKVGENIIFSKNNGLQNQSVYYIQKGMTGQPKVFIDPNIMSADGTVSIVLDNPSVDKKYISYHINKNGSDWSTTYIMDIEANKPIKDSIQWMRGDVVSWVKGGFYYVRYPKPEKGKELTAVALDPRVYYHQLGDDQANDRFIYDYPADPKMGLGVQITEDGRFLFIYQAPGSDGYDVLGKRLDVVNDPIKMLFKGYTYQYNILDNIGDDLLVNTNEDAGNFKVVRVNYSNTAKANWKEIIPEKKERIDNAAMAGGKIILSYLKDASSKIYQYNPDGKLEHEVVLPAIGSAGGFGGYRDDKVVFYTFTSFTYPPGVFSYDLQTGKSAPFKQTESKINLGDYETEQIFYSSKDGTKVPMFLIHKKGIKADGSHPTLLYAYGGFDISETPYFNPTSFVLLQNNGIYAVANIRGGGEYGEAWHKAGELGKKQNVFDDFIAAGEYLIKANYTTKDKLGIIGGSNGGLLIGAVMTERPDLCKVAIPEMGVMDMLRFQKFTSGVFWTSEYGSSDNASDFQSLYKYSPVHNVKSRVQYPATLVLTADHDDRVVPMHSFKFAAALQDKQTGASPVLIRISTNQGHGASGSSLQKNIEATTDIYSFLFYNMGITPAFKDE